MTEYDVWIQGLRKRLKAVEKENEKLMDAIGRIDRYGICSVCKRFHEKCDVEKSCTFELDIGGVG